MRVARPGRDAITTDASPPTTSAITVAIAANSSELRSAVHGETNSVLVDALEPSARYEVEAPVPADVQRSPDEHEQAGTPRNSVVPPRHADDDPLARRARGGATSPRRDQPLR